MKKNSAPIAGKSGRFSNVQNRFDRLLTPHALSIALQEGTLVPVGFQSTLLLRVHTGSSAEL